MNSLQKQEILNEIERFRKADFETAFKNHFKEVATFDSIIIADYPFPDLLALAKRAINQLEERLNSEDWQILPNATTLPEYGPITLNVNIAHITNRLLAPQYTSAALSIKAQVYYQMTNNFWNQPKRIELSIRESSLSKLEERANLLMIHIERQEKHVNNILETLKTELKEIESFTSTKKREFVEITNNQTKSNSIISSIQNTQTLVNGYNKEIEQTKIQCIDILGQLKKAQDTTIEQQQRISAQSKDAENLIEKIWNNTDSIKDKISKDQKAVSEYTENIKQMMGYIADGTLSHSFNTRKQAITKRTRMWMWISLFLLVLMVGWICVVFFCLSAETNSVWANIIINGIKSSPLVFAFGYALNEYSKERNLLEEYAFRESVAVTLTSYMEQLGGKEDSDQRVLLMNTVEQLYTKPLISRKEYKMFNIDINESLKRIEEILKTIKR